MDVPVDANVEDKERDSTPSANLFRILNVAAGQRLDRQAIDKSYIVFYLSGHNMSVCNNSRAKRLSEGMTFLIPKHACVYGMSLTDSEYLLCEIPMNSRSVTDRICKAFPKSSLKISNTISTPCR